MCQDSQVLSYVLIIFVVCKRAFTRAEIKISYKDGSLVVSLRDKNQQEEFQECFRIDQHIDLSYEKFMFISAISGMALNNHHYIYSIKTFDLDVRVDKDRYERERKSRKASAQQDQFVKAVTRCLIINHIGRRFNTQKGRQQY